MVTGLAICGLSASVRYFTTSWISWIQLGNQRVREGMDVVRVGGVVGIFVGQANGVRHLEGTIVVAPGYTAI